MTITKIIFVLMIFASTLIAQQKSELIKVVGDSLIGKVVSGESIREVYGHVILSQGNVVVTCDKAIQNIAMNNAILIGNVIVKQDSLIITTDEGFYYGNTKTTKSNKGIILNDQKVILTADSGEYHFNNDVAFFQSNVTLFDSITTLFADHLTYYRNDDRAVSVGNVQIVDDENKIFADTLDHYRKTKTSFADGHVKIISLKNRTTIYGSHLEDYAQRKYTLINENPVLIQMDSTYTKENELSVDTLLITAKTMEAFRDTANIFKAVDSVKINRNEFASVNDFTLYFRDNDLIITKKISEDAAQPILWYGNSQLTGDSLNIFLKDNKIKELDAFGNAFMLSQSKRYLKRFDQTSSQDIKITFRDDKIFNAIFTGTMHSIYYLYDNGDANGLSKSSAKDATLVFENNEVSEVRLYESPTSEYYPEKQIVGNERTFLLPKFKFFKNRPSREQLLKLIWK